MSRPLLNSIALSVALCGAAAQAAPQGIPASNLNAEVFYQLLVSEISANKGDAATAYALMLDAARKTNSAKAYERAVELALQARSGESALQAAQAWSKAMPGSREANRYLIQILIGLNRSAEAIEPLKRDLAALPVADRIVAIGLLPRYFARNADKSAAAKTLEQALASELNNEATGGAAWTAIGRLRQAAADMTGTVDAVRKAAELTPLSEEPIYLALTLTGNAAQVTQSQVDKFMAGTTTAELRMAYARTLLDKDRSADAYSQCVLINQQKPSLADAWLVRGSLEAQEKRWNEASTSLKRYISVLSEQADGSAPKEAGRGWAQGHILLAQIADINSQPQEALAYLAQIDSPQDAMRVLKLRTTILAKQGKLEEARQAIRNAPESSEGDDRAKRGIEIQLLRDHQQFAEAYTLLEQAIAKYPQDYDLAYDLAMVADKLGKLVEMEQILRRIIAAKPDYHHAYNALGYSFAERNIRLPEARQLIVQALKSAPNDPYILDSLAWVEFRSGNNAEALRILQNAYKTRPDAEIAAHLGEVLWVMGQRNEALDIWRQGTLLNPDNATLQETIARFTRKP